MTEVILALVGVFFGWALGLGSELWRGRQLARRAARIIAVELIQGAGVLESVRDKQTRIWSPMGWKLQTTAWEAHGSTVLGILSEADSDEIQKAYIAIGAFQRVLDVWHDQVANAYRTFESESAQLRQALQSHSMESAKPRGRKLAVTSDSFVATAEVYAEQAQRTFDRSVTGVDELIIAAHDDLTNAQDQLRVASGILGRKA